MDVETWKSVWYVGFFIASAFFYVVVLIVAIKGMGDVKEVVSKMIQGRRLNS
jgi:hypothetical protein